MPFPPDYTRAWSNTFPPDTQLAKLLGQDLREFREDVAERFFLSGTLAERPTSPGTLFPGFLYFATDVRRTYRWSGTEWTFVRGFADVVVSTIIGPPTNIGVVNMATIGADRLAAGSIVRATFSFAKTGGASPTTFTTSVYGQVVDSVVLAVGQGAFIEIEVRLTDLANAATVSKRFNVTVAGTSYNMQGVAADFAALGTLGVVANHGGFAGVAAGGMSICEIIV